MIVTKRFYSAQSMIVPVWWSWSSHNRDLNDKPRSAKGQNSFNYDLLLLQNDNDSLSSAASKERISDLK